MGVSVGTVVGQHFEHILTKWPVNGIVSLKNPKGII